VWVFARAALLVMIVRVGVENRAPSTG